MPWGGSHLQPVGGKGPWQGQATRANPPYCYSIMAYAMMAVPYPSHEPVG